MYIVIWQDANAKYEWETGYIKVIIAAGYIVDHLHRAISNTDTKWKYPKIEDIQCAEEDQISPDSRKMLFTLHNIQQVQAAVQKVFR